MRHIPAFVLGFCLPLAFGPVCRAVADFLSAL